MGGQKSGTGSKLKLCFPAAVIHVCTGAVHLLSKGQVPMSGMGMGMWNMMHLKLGPRTRRHMRVGRAESNGGGSGRGGSGVAFDGLRMNLVGMLLRSKRVACSHRGMLVMRKWCMHLRSKGRRDVHDRSVGVMGDEAVGFMNWGVELWGIGMHGCVVFHWQLVILRRGSRSGRRTSVIPAANELLGGNLLCREETAARAAGTTHGMFMAGLVEIGLTLPTQAMYLLEPCTGDATLENAKILLCVYIEGLFVDCWVYLEMICGRS